MRRPFVKRKENFGNPPLFPSSEKVGQKGRPCEKPFPSQASAFAGNAGLAPLKHAAFLLPQTLARSGLFNGEAPPSHPSLHTFLPIEEPRVNSKGRGEKDTLPPLYFHKFLHDIFSCFTIAYVHTHRNFWGIARDSTKQLIFPRRETMLIQGPGKVIPRVLPRRFALCPFFFRGERETPVSFREGYPVPPVRAF